MPLKNTLSPLSEMTGTLKALSLVLTLVLAASCAPPPPDPVPKQIDKIKLGMTIQQVEKMIKDSGKLSTAPGKLRKATTVLTWIPPDNPYFKKITFRFAETGPLYLVGFFVRDELRWKLRPVKEGLMAKYDITPERPAKLKPTGKFMSVYMSSDKKTAFFEFKDMETGETWFELFSPGISHKARQSVSEKNGKKEGKKEGKGKPLMAPVRPPSSPGSETTSPNSGTRSGAKLESGERDTAPGAEKNKAETTQKSSGPKREPASQE